jgi:hypothetical protein
VYGSAALTGRGATATARAARDVDAREVLDPAQIAAREALDS